MVSTSCSTHVSELNSGCSWTRPDRPGQALPLDLAGRAVPRSSQVAGRHFMAEHYDVVAGWHTTAMAVQRSGASCDPCGELRNSHGSMPTTCGLSSSCRCAFVQGHERVVGRIWPARNPVGAVRISWVLSGKDGDLATSDGKGLLSYRLDDEGIGRTPPGPDGRSPAGSPSFLKPVACSWPWPAGIDLRPKPKPLPPIPRNPYDLSAAVGGGAVASTRADVPLRVCPFEGSGRDVWALRPAIHATKVNQCPHAPGFGPQPHRDHVAR
jgi:hypothetical protein